MIYDYDGPRHLRKYRSGPGVCAALLIRNGFKVVSWRDHRTLQKLFKKLDTAHVVDEAARDHHERDWYRGLLRELIAMVPMARDPCVARQGSRVRSGGMACMPRRARTAL